MPWIGRVADGHDDVILFTRCRRKSVGRINVRCGGHAALIGLLPPKLAVRLISAMRCLCRGRAGEVPAPERRSQSRVEVVAASSRRSEHCVTRVRCHQDLRPAPPRSRPRRRHRVPPGPCGTRCARSDIDEITVRWLRQRARRAAGYSHPRRLEDDLRAGGIAEVERRSRGLHSERDGGEGQPPSPESFRQPPERISDLTTYATFPDPLST